MVMIQNQPGAVVDVLDSIFARESGRAKVNFFLSSAGIASQALENTEKNDKRQQTEAERT